MDKPERNPFFEPGEKNGLAKSGWDSSLPTTLGAGNPWESWKESGLAEITIEV